MFNTLWFYQFKDIVWEWQFTDDAKQATKKHGNTILTEMFRKSSNAVVSWQSIICKRLTELSHFNFYEIHMLADFIADNNEVGSIGMWTTNTSKRLVKDLKLAYSISNKVDALRKILKYQDIQKQFKAWELNCRVFSGDSTYQISHPPKFQLVGLFDRQK